MRSYIPLLFLLLSISCLNGQSEQFIATIPGITSKSICELKDSSLMFSGTLYFDDPVVNQRRYHLVVAKTSRNGIGSFYNEYSHQHQDMSEGDIQTYGDSAILVTTGVGNDVHNHKLVLCKMNTEGVLKWCKYFNVPAGTNTIAVNENTGSIIVQYKLSSVRGAYLACIGNHGNVQWSKRFDIDTFQVGISQVKFLPDNGFVLAGSVFEESIAASITARFDSTGNLMWCRRVDIPPSSIGPWSIAYIDDLIFCSGTFDNVNWHPWHPYVISFDMDGNYRFLKMYYSPDWGVCENFSMTAMHDKTLVFNTEPEGGSVARNHWGGLIKIDTLGNVLAKNNFFISDVIFPQEVIETNDHYALALGNMTNYQIGLPPQSTTIIKINTDFRNACFPFTPLIIALDTLPQVFSGGSVVNASLTNSDIVLYLKRVPMNPDIVCYNDTNSVGIQELMDEDVGVKIFPNPASEKITIEVSDWNFKEIDLTLFNMVGESLFHHHFNSYKEEIDISVLPKGIYVAQLISEQKRTRKKFVKWGN